jgi:hypothetical protein
LLLLVIGTIIGIYVLRYALLDYTAGSRSQVIASIINALIIQGLNQLYLILATELTEWENHRTETEFESLMVSKLFIFQFVNSYASLFYLAFIADSMGDCSATGGSCMPALAWNLAILSLIRFFFNHCYANVLYPAYKYAQNLKNYIDHMCINRKNFVNLSVREFMGIYTRDSHGTIFGKLLGHGPNTSERVNSMGSSSTSLTGQSSVGTNSNYITSIERDFVKNPFDIQRHEFKTFADLMIQFGYTSLFTTALPLITLFTYFVNLFHFRYETQLFFTVYQRPIPRSAENIGEWQDIMDIMTKIAVVSNAAIVIFTMKLFDAYSWKFQLWMFLIFQWGGWILQVNYHTVFSLLRLSLIFSVSE